MKKLLTVSTLALSTVLLTSCSINSKNQKRDVSSVREETELDDVFEKDIPPRGEGRVGVSTENTHELVDAAADDVTITQAVGVKNIDDELENDPEEKVPYARNFLANKRTKRMEFWVEYFTKRNRERFQRFINNGEEYRHHIEKILVEHGVPKELYFVGLIESGYYLGARSHASAVGPWQFIRDTGRRYGLSVTKEIDERQDLFKATRSAAMYFKDLHNIFSSWELALSAYNAGEYGIIRRILKHGTRDFYVLSKNKQLPDETINYVPKVLAAMYVVNNAEKYGFVIPKKKNRFFDHTELRAIKKNIPLSTIAKRMNVDLQILKKLNPELKLAKTPAQVAGTYYLRVPKSQYAYKLNDISVHSNVAATGERPETRKQLVRRTAALESAQSLLNSEPVRVIKAKEIKKNPEFYTVKRGDTLISISRKFKTTPRSLAEMNNLKSWRSQVRIGQRLALTQSEEQNVSVKFASMPKLKATTKPVVYQVKRGDNLAELARVFGKDIRQIKQVNQLKKNKILVGQKIVLPSSQKGIYTVRKGDHLMKVSKELKQPMEAIIKLNDLNKKMIYPGQKLIVDMD